MSPSTAVRPRFSRLPFPRAGFRVIAGWHREYCSAWFATIAAAMDHARERFGLQVGNDCEPWGIFDRDGNPVPREYCVNN